MGGVCGKDSSKSKAKKEKKDSSRKNHNANLFVSGHRERSRISNTNANNQNELDMGNNALQSVTNRNQNYPNSQGINPLDILTGRNRGSPSQNHQRQETENNNNMNISINEEFPSRRVNNLNRGGNVNLYPGVGNMIPITLQNLMVDENGTNIHNQSEMHFCSLCYQSFSSQLLYQRHLTDCGGLRNTRTMHNSINEILHLVHSLNRQLEDGPINLLSILGEEKPEESSDYFDWTHYKTEDGSVVWKNLGKVHLTKEEMNKISLKSHLSVSNEKYFIKRVWLLKYINSKIYDNTCNNSPLVISRENVLEESFNQFMTTSELDLKKAMQIFFVDEVAQDVGGVYREWYTILFDSIFSDQHGFFYQINDQCLGRNTFYLPTNLPKIYFNNYLDYYEFIGKVVAKAVFDKITIKTNFNMILIKHLLGVKIGVEDLKYIDNGYYQSLKSIIDYKISSPSELYFTWNIRNSNNELEEMELVPGGKLIMITEDNKYTFVNKAVEFITYLSTKDKIDALKKGFQLLIPDEVINIFSPEEFDFLLSGQSNIDLNDWQVNTVYKGYYNETYPTIKSFWQILSKLSAEKLLLFYKFCTGCTRVPIDGFSSLQGTRNKYQKFCIESPPLKDKKDTNRLIEAKTCFNRIYLPDYDSIETMEKIINTIIDNDTNFFGKQ